MNNCHFVDSQASQKQVSLEQLSWQSLDSRLGDFLLPNLKKKIKKSITKIKIKTKKSSN